MELVDNQGLRCCVVEYNLVGVLIWNDWIVVLCAFECIAANVERISWVRSLAAPNPLSARVRVHSDDGGVRSMTRSWHENEKLPRLLNRPKLGFGPGLFDALLHCRREASMCSNCFLCFQPKLGFPLSYWEMRSILRFWDKNILWVRKNENFYGFVAPCEMRVGRPHFEPKQYTITKYWSSFQAVAFRSAQRRW